MKLYGSLASPYVRRVRILLHGTTFEFINIQVFDPADRAVLVEKNPTLKVPMLVDGKQILFDSRVIYRYLSEKWSWSPLSWQQENLLTLIDAVNDSLVQLFILRRSGIEPQPSLLFYSAQEERIRACLQTIERALQDGEFSQWAYPSICLYSMVDWALFRELYCFDDYPKINAFMSQYTARQELVATDPRCS